MALVVQVINRGGVVIGAHRFNGNRLVLGRALDCDVALQDPHVDAHHLEIIHDAETGRLSCRDLGSRNGSWRILHNHRGVPTRKKAAVQGACPFFSGQTFELGKSHVRVFSAQHAVPPALPLSRWEALGHTLGHWWVFGVLGILLMALQVWDNYLSEPNTQKLSQFALSALYPVLATVVYAGVWAFIGRNIRHDAKFTSHVSAALAAALAVAVFEFLAPYWAFNWSLWRWAGSATAAFTALVVFALGFVTLTFATYLRGVSRTAVALIAPLVLLIPASLDILGEPDFREVPPYDRSLVEPNWQFKKGVPVSEFFSAVPELYQQPEVDLGTDKPSAE